jgi:hypothetical protein
MGEILPTRAMSLATTLNWGFVLLVTIPTGIGKYSNDLTIDLVVGPMFFICGGFMICVTYMSSFIKI